MTPPTAPRLDPVKIIFFDDPANIAVEDIFQPDKTTFTEFLASLCTLSGSIIDKLDDFGKTHGAGQGFTREDGCWWYRIINQSRKSLWKTLDSPSGYDAMVAEMTLGETTTGGWIEVQHNMQKLRDQAKGKEDQSCDLDSGLNQLIGEDGPGPVVNTTYEGPIIINGGLRTQEPTTSTKFGPAPVVALSSVEKFPDIEMQDTTYPFAPLHPSLFQPQPQRMFQLHGHNPYLSQLEGAYLPSSQHPRAQYQPKSYNQHNGKYQQQAPGAFNPFQLQSYHEGGQSNNYNNNNKKLRGQPKSQHENGRNNTFNIRGYGRGRGRGGGLPSFTKRPPPFPAQLGTPPVDAHAQWKAAHQHELDEEDAKLAAEEEEKNYHTSFQTGSPKSGGGIQSKLHRKKGQGHQSPNGATSRQDRSNAATPNAWDYGPENLANLSTQQYLQPGGPQRSISAQTSANQRSQTTSVTFSAGYQSSPYFGFNPRNQNRNASGLTVEPQQLQINAPGATFNPRQQKTIPLRFGLDPALENNASQAWSHNPLFPNNQYANDPACYTPQSGFSSPTMSNTQYQMQPLNLFPGYDAMMYDDQLFNLNMNTSMNTDLMTESEIDAAVGTSALTNPNSRVPSSSSSRIFSNPYYAVPPQVTSASICPSPNLSGYYSQPDYVPQLRNPRIGTLAPTLTTADAFNDQLYIGRMMEAQAEQARLNQNRNDKAKNKKHNKDSGAKKQKVKTNVNFPPGVTKAAPPIGDFSPLKPMKARKERAKKVFKMQEAEENKSGESSGHMMPTTDENGATIIHDIRAKIAEIKAGSSVNFSKGANLNRPTCRTLTSNIKFGFEDMEDAEQDLDLINANENSDSELSEQSRSPSPTSSLLGLAQDDTLDANGMKDRKPLSEKVSKRLQTRLLNRAKEKMKQEKLTKKMEVKLEMQKEGRAERAKRRASGWSLGDGSGFRSDGIKGQEMETAEGGGDDATTRGKSV